MYFEFACSSCGKNLKVRPEHAGRRVSCPYCRSQIVVPDTQDDKEEVEDQVESGPQLQVGSPTTSLAHRRAAARAGSQRWADGTNVSMLISGGIGVALAAAFYILMFPLSETGIGKLFIKEEHGWWVPPALTFLMGWAVAILVLKSRKLKRQKQSMLFDMLPNELSRDITVDHVERFVSHVQSLPVSPGESFLVNRVLRGLEHFRVRRSAAEVSTVMASQSEIDANSVDSSYTLMKVFIWAIPILGFIGTVIGIGAAVESFSSDLDGAKLEELKESLNSVTGGLATAFDTTLVALVMSMLVMFPASSMQKSEEDLLNWVDEYCNENLLKRLDDGRLGADRGAGGGSPLDVKRAIDAAMAAHHAEIKAWTKKLEAIGGTLTNQVAQGWQRIQEQHLTRAQELERMAGQFQTNIAGMSQSAETTQQQVAENMRQSAESINAYVAELERGLRGLSEVLAELGQQQVLIQQAPRRGWFSGRRKNGGQQDDADKWR
jgi:biopolymer transport protein ExbB/TolQ/DNA-directed RNA polymerase subunit RPC12/RpoP